VSSSTTALALVAPKGALAPAILEPVIGPPRGGALKSAFLERWIRGQAHNAVRHTDALRPFRPGEFGTHAASPTEAHRIAANALIIALREPLGRIGQAFTDAAHRAAPRQEASDLQPLTMRKEQSQQLVEAVERVWHFYFELFNQRQTQVAGFLLASDRIALDCYQAVYTNLGCARSIPSPPPFSYMEGGFGPATFRRHVLLTKLGKLANPFPLVKLPYHRLVNPWTLGAIPHEVSHNIQSDLGLWDLLPRTIFRGLRGLDIPREAALTWARWHKETFADLLGVLLIGPSFVGSLMDIVAKAPVSTIAFNPRGVHPTPYLRVFINLELLARLAFDDDADEMRRAWKRLYAGAAKRLIPPAIRQTFRRAARAVVDIICFQPYRELGGKTLAEVVAFAPRHRTMVREASERLAAGVDPGILPERFLIGAARWAHDRNLASPAIISRNFYQALGRR
jgi:hypothetical protein